MSTNRVDYSGLEMDKIENAAFEAGRRSGLGEAAAMLDADAQDYNRMRDPGMANHCRAKAKRIRALVKSGGAS
jgi:hypothetical protein